MFGSSWLYFGFAEITFEGPAFFIGTGLAVIFSLLYVAKKLKTISKLKEQNESLSSTLRKMDQQAKLILKNDIELRLYQKKIEQPSAQLDLLKKLTLSASETLDKEELFSKITPAFLEEMGFKKGLVLDFNSFKKVHSVGFETQEIDFIENYLFPKKNVFKEEHLLTSFSETCQAIKLKLNLKNMLVSPVKTKDKIFAVFLIAGLIDSTSVESYQENTFLLLCSYLAQKLTNIDFFEQMYRIREELESKIKNRTKELAFSLNQLKATSRAKSDFISSVSHELRTPLTSVKGFSSLLADEKFGKLPEEAKKRLDKVVDNVDKLMDIVNTLLDISRIESGKMEINATPEDFSLLAKNVADFFEPQSREKKINIDLEIPPTLVVHMDKNLIERVLINLINNALKFTPENGLIKITCQEEKEKAIISVSDTGYGIPEADLNKIFEEFYRVRAIEQKAIKGSGLGLSLVKKIIEGHKEKIWVASELGKGTSFSFSLLKKKSG